MSDPTYARFLRRLVGAAAAGALGIYAAAVASGLPNHCSCGSAAALAHVPRSSRAALPPIFILHFSSLQLSNLWRLLDLHGLVADRISKGRSQEKMSPLS